MAAVLQNKSEPTEQQTTNGNGQAPNDEKFSDSEEELEPVVVSPPQLDELVVEEPQLVPPTFSVAEPSVISTPEPLTSIRKRILDRPPSSASALPLVDRQVNKIQMLN